MTTRCDPTDATAAVGLLSHSSDTTQGDTTDVSCPARQTGRNSPARRAGAGRGIRIILISALPDLTAHDRLSRGGVGQWLDPGEVNHLGESSRRFAAIRSAVSKPSVNLS